MSIEYRVRRVERFIVTRHESAVDPSGGVHSVSSRQIGGEHDNADVAYQVGYALARQESELLGLPPGDMGVVFPQHPNEASFKSQGVAVDA
jgi:hypothetical protein